MSENTFLIVVALLATAVGALAIWVAVLQRRLSLLERKPFRRVDFPKFVSVAKVGWHGYEGGR